MKRRILLAGTGIVALLLGFTSPVTAQPQPSDASSPSSQAQQGQDGQTQEGQPSRQANEQQRERQAEQARQRQNEQRQNEQRQGEQARQRQTQQSSDDDATEYRGSERAALGVMLREGRDGQVSISQVVSGSPAEEAGIQRGDQISKIDDQEVNTYRDVIRLINRKSPDDEIQITVQRDGDEKQLTVSLEPRADVFDQNQQFSQRTRDFDSDRAGQRSARDGQWRTDRSQQQAYDRSPQGRSRATDSFGRQPGQWQQGQWQQDQGRYADDRQQPYYDRQQQFDDRSYQSDRFYRDQYGRDRDRQYTDRTARSDDRRMDDRYREPFSARDNWQQQRTGQRLYSQRESDRPTLGIGLRTSGNALQVSQVYRNSPAEDAGLRRGDQIVAVEGRQVRSYEQLLQALDQHEAGDRVTLAIVRNGQRQQVDAELQESDAYYQDGQNQQQQGSRQSRDGFSQDRQDRWDNRDRSDGRQRFENEQEQRTGGQDWEAGRKQTGEAFDADFDF